MPVDPDVVPLLDAKADKSALDALAQEVAALKTAGVKAHAHTEFADKIHAHAGEPVPTPAPPVPPPPPPPVPPIPGPTLPDVPAGTDVNASELVAKLAAAPNGAVFRVRPGSAGGTLTLKPGQQVWALDPANRPLFDGAGTQWFARGAGSAADTVLGYLRFKGYAPANPSWVNVQGDSYRRHGGIDGFSLPGMRLYRCEGFENGLAAKVGNNWLIEECLFHHNHHMCLSSYQVSGAKIIGGEWHNNNRRPDGQPYFDWRWEAGQKFVASKNFLIEGVYSHHNYGPGIWADIGNDLFVFRNNRCEDNVASGIFWEISHRALIEGNTCLRNRDAANIYVSNSRGTAAEPIRVRNNVTDAHSQWEIGMQNDSTRGETNYPWLDFVRVEDNVVGSKPIKLYTRGTSPAPTSIVVSGNKRPDGTPVGLT